MNYWLLAVRNIIKNRRSSAMTIAAIAAGFAAVTLFAGYVTNVYNSLVRQAIHGEVLGHLSISKRGLHTEGKLQSERFLFTKTELDLIAGLVKQYRHTVLVTPRLSLTGLITNGKASTIFIGEGVVAGDTKILQANFQLRSANNESDTSSGVAIAYGLGGILKLSAGNSAAVLVDTAGRRANALDVNVIDTFDTGNAGTNDKFIYFPLELAQRLYGVDGAERIIVLLDDRKYADDAREFLMKPLRQSGFDVEIQTWLELSSFYKQVRSLFDMIFLFVFGIVLLIVIMSVVNSMNMTVAERTREISTLRALGLRRGGIVRLFTIEALTLVVSGCVIGLAFMLAVRLCVNAAGIMYQPPNSSKVVHLLIDVDGMRTAATFALMTLLGVMAAYIPARRAARQAIVNSLEHVR
jgi:putative ABC transport system permease protein